MFRRSVSLLVGVLMVALVGVVPVGTAEAVSIGGITVTLEGVDPQTSEQVFMAVGTGTGAFSDAKPASKGIIGTAQVESFFDVLFNYEAMYTGDDGPHDLMVRGTGQGRLPDPVPGGPSRAEMVLQANVVVDDQPVGDGPVNIGLLSGVVQLDPNGNPSVFGSSFSLQNAVGPFQLPGLRPFIFPPNDHRIQGPEPSALLLLGAGLAGLGAATWRRRRSG